MKVFRIVISLLVISLISLMPLFAEKKHSEYDRVKSVIEYSIGWAVEKDFDKMFEVWAHDENLYHHWLTSKSTVRGFEAFKKHADTWRDPDFKGTYYKFKDLRITFSKSGDVAWYSCYLDDCYEYKGKPGCVKDVHQTGVLEKRDGKWVHVLMHGSYPVDKIPEPYLRAYYKELLKEKPEQEKK